MSIPVPTKPIGIDKASAELRTRYQEYLEKLNKPILTIAPSSIAATIAFVGAIADPKKITNLNGIVLVSSWASWLLSIVFILVSYALVLASLKEAMEWAERFTGYEFSNIQTNAGNLKDLVEQNRARFSPKESFVKWSDRCQWAALFFFIVGFVCFFIFVSVQLIWW